MIPLAAYADRLSARPGETIRFHGAGKACAGAKAAIHRVISADPNPEIAGVRTEQSDAAVQFHDLPTEPPLALGSYGVVKNAAPVATLEDYTVAFRVSRAANLAKEQALISIHDPGPGLGFGLAFDDVGRVFASLGSHGAWSRLELPEPQAVGRWYLVWLSRDAATDRVELGQMALQGGDADRESQHTVEAQGLGGAPAGLSTILFGANAEDVHDWFRFSGRIEHPMLFDRPLSRDEVTRAATGESIDGLVACWDFSQDISSDRIVDIGPHGLHGLLVNSPTRAVRGSKWSGREMCWRHAPDEYAAIHFHEDDIDDCNWPVVAEFTVPDDFKSGQYALMLEADGHTENVPFWVVPPKGKPSARIAVLVSTFTYTVYGNHARPEWTMDPNWQQAWRDQAAGWDAYPHNAADHPDLGLSTYNNHTDGSGISIASWHRPMLNTRLGYLTYPYPEIRGSGLRHYPADSHLTMWLEAKGFDYDIITDWELHHEGHNLLNNYQVVMTGSHPEYHTREMLDALEAYRDGGGRFCYLGGNGFYWKIALCPYKDGVIEIRRR